MFHVVGSGGVPGVPLVGAVCEGNMLCWETCVSHVVGCGIVSWCGVGGREAVMDAGFWDIG